MLLLISQPCSWQSCVAWASVNNSTVQLWDRTWLLWLRSPHSLLQVSWLSQAFAGSFAQLFSLMPLQIQPLQLPSLHPGSLPKLLQIGPVITQPKKTWTFISAPCSPGSQRLTAHYPERGHNCLTDFVQHYSFAVGGCCIPIACSYSPVASLNGCYLPVVTQTSLKLLFFHTRLIFFLSKLQC